MMIATRICNYRVISSLETARRNGPSVVSYSTVWEGTDLEELYRFFPYSSSMDLDPLANKVSEDGTALRSFTFEHQFEDGSWEVTDDPRKDSPNHKWFCPGCRCRLNAPFVAFGHCRTCAIRAGLICGRCEHVEPNGSDGFCEDCRNFKNPARCLSCGGVHIDDSLTSDDLCRECSIIDKRANRWYMKFFRRRAT